MPGSAHDPLRKIQAEPAPQTTTDIGSVLQAARQKRGQSVQAVVTHTRIPKRYVEALEANQLDEFPALAYLRAFLKTYCDYLEVDFEPLWRQIAPPPAAAPARPAGQSAGKEPRPPAPRAGGDPAMAALAALGLAGALGLFLAFFLRRGDRPQAEEPAPPPAALAPLRAAATPTLGIEFREAAWISVQSDGRVAFEGFVPKNSRQEWTARRTLALQTSDPGALRLTLNGARYALPAPDSRGVYRIEVP